MHRTRRDNETCLSELQLFNFYFFIFYNILCTYYYFALRICYFMKAFIVSRVLCDEIYIMSGYVIRSRILAPTPTQTQTPLVM